jgi:pSer/pThr/pTyr-binding forkhead associated (FHA) protein
MIVRKLLVSDGRNEREVLLVGTIVVGRDPSCQLNDLDPLLSRRHAEFVPSGKGVTVRDLESRNGILVNGDKVPEHLLKPGDVVQLGHLHVRYMEEPVVKSPEDHSRVRAKTETGIEVPTMAPPPKAPVKASAPPAAAAAPTTSAPIFTSGDDTELDDTVAPPARSRASAPSAPARPPAPKQFDDDLDATMAVGRAAARPAAEPDADRLELPPLPSLEGLTAGDADDLDLDATMATARQAPSPASAAAATKHEVDPDATRMPWAKATVVAEDPDATVATKGATFDGAIAPAAQPQPPSAATRTSQSPEARVVANMSLVVTEASPNCQTVIGARPDTIVGGHLSDAITRTLRFVATGDGPTALSMAVVRQTSDNTITVTFTTGQANGNHS